MARQATRQRNGERLSEQDWVQAALQRMALTRIDEVRVEPLARELGVTKGSFYWHFKNRQELLEKMLELWKERATVGVTRRIRELVGDTIEGLEQLLSLPARTPPNKLGVEMELAIRDWARNDPLAARVVHEIDLIRLAHMQEFFIDLGYDVFESRRRASIALSYMLGNSLLKSDDSVDERVLMAKACVAYLTGDRDGRDRDS